MPDGLTFAINPQTQAASIDLFLKALEDIRRLLRDVDYAIHRERTVRRWIISDLHSSSPTVSVRPLLDDEEMVRVIAAGIRDDDRDGVPSSGDRCGLPEIAHAG